MNQSRLVMLAMAGSAALFLSALGFQYLADLAPCKMCIGNAIRMSQPFFAALAFLL